jgi:hypothetical protein
MQSVLLSTLADLFIPKFGAAPGRRMEQSRSQRAVALCWLVAVILGSFCTWEAFYQPGIDTDMISYLDVGDAYLRGDWRVAINGYWSPFYSWILGLAMFLLKPSPSWEFSVLHLVNFVIYLCTMGCFHFFLREVIHYHRSKMTRVSSSESVALPTWAWLALGYTLFIWTALHWITIHRGPDLCVAAFVYLASGIVLRIRMGSVNWLTFGLLGAVLGFGYLAKTAMFLLALVFLGASMLSVGNFRRAIPLVLIAFIAFVSVSGPFIIALSKAKGYPTFGLTGKLNYAWYVNGIKRFRYWQGEPPRSGTPKHPVRRISTSETPVIYEFATPIGGTYPLWYDASYWYEGLVTHFDLKRQIRVFIQNAAECFRFLFPSHSSLITGLLILFMVSCRRLSFLKAIAAQWSLLIPAMAAFIMYSLVYIERRYIGAFNVVFWMAIFSGVYLHNSQESRRLILRVTLAMVLSMIFALSYLPAEMIFAASRHWITKGSGDPLPVHVATGLSHIGVQPGDKVAVIGNALYSASMWARLARVRIVADMPGNEQNFWAANPYVQSQIIKIFASTGAKVIVAEEGPHYGPTNGWQPIENTRHYAYMLPVSGEREREAVRP